MQSTKVIKHKAWVLNLKTYLISNLKQLNLIVILETNRDKTRAISIVNLLPIGEITTTIAQITIYE